MIAPQDPAIKAARARRREAIRQAARADVAALVLAAHPKDRRALACAHLSAWADTLEVIVGPLAGITALAAEQGRRCALIGPDDAKRLAAETVFSKARMQGHAA